MSTAVSAAARQSIGNRRTHTGRRILTVLGIIVGLSFALPAAALAPKSVDARAGLSCGGWTSTTQPPKTIRVLRHRSGRVVTVNFQRYVVTVMGKEWPSYLPYQVLEAGAVAVKQYGWYHALNGHQKVSRRGDCYDVIDTTRDQLYKPHKARIRADQRSAVNLTLGHQPDQGRPLPDDRLPAWPQAELRPRRDRLQAFRPERNQVRTQRPRLVEHPADLLRPAPAHHGPEPAADRAGAPRMIVRPAISPVARGTHGCRQPPGPEEA